MTPSTSTEQQKIAVTEIRLPAKEPAVARGGTTTQLLGMKPECLAESLL
jgi:hypothetical protein